MFVHLHNHSCYSLLDGYSKPKQMIAKAAELEQPKIALTDHGGMWGVFDLWKAARDWNRIPRRKVEPILGNELYYTSSDRRERDKGSRSYHLLALIMNEVGYRNLSILTSLSYTEGFYRKPRIDRELLEKYNEGIIFSAACMAGWPQRLIVEDKLDEAKGVAAMFKDMLGDRYYLELQDTGIEDQPKINKALLDIGKQLGIQPIVTNDAHFCNKKDIKVHDVLSKMQISEDTYKYNYLRSSEEMYKLFPGAEEACRNTLVVADRCEFGFPKKYYMPAYQMTDEEKEKFDNSEILLDHLIKTGIEARYMGSERDKAFKQVEYEIGVIRQMGFNDYLLIFWDLIGWCKRNRIPVGPGRGSAAGSIACYALGITNLDPFKYELMFERFLNPDRISMPDIDVDFCRDRRGEVVDYIKQRYGEMHTCQIITFSGIKSKAAIRDAGRISENVSLEKVDEICKLIREAYGKPQRLEEAFEGKEDERSPVLHKMLEDENIRELYNTARDIEDLPRNYGVHAAGVVISDIPVVERVPVQLDKTKKFRVTQFDKDQIDDLGLLKMDILGLATLTIINKALELIEIRKNTKIDLNRIPLDDAQTFHLIGQGFTKGVFQLDKPGMQKFLIKMKPMCLDDIIAAGALHRPGPMKHHLDSLFVARKQGTQEVRYDHEDLKPILGNTMGVMTYQEQIIAILRNICGWSVSEADRARKAIGKKKKEDLQRLGPKIKEDGTARGYTPELMDTLWGQVENFAEYGFNRSHAACYGLLGYQTAWLKTHFNIEYYTALMTVEHDKTDEIADYCAEAKAYGLKILPPDVNKSDVFAKPEGEKTLRFGLASIKGVGVNAAVSIVGARKKAKFKTLTDVVASSRQVNKRVAEALVKSGAVDKLYSNPAYAWDELETALAKGAHKAKLQSDGYEPLFEDAKKEEVRSVLEWDDQVKLQNEADALGFYLTSFPLDKYTEVLESFNGFKQIEDVEIEKNPENEDIDQVVVTAGILSSPELRTTKKGKRFITSELRGRRAKISCLCFNPELFDIFEEGKLLAVEGNLRDDRGLTLFAKEAEEINENFHVRHA